MANIENIELVIKIPKEKYNQIINSYKGSKVRPKDYEIAIINGTPLPKGHGRIVDIGLYEEKVIASRKYCGVNRLIEVAELDTIIEADTESRC